MKEPSVFVRMLETAAHPTLRGHMLFAGERYNVKIDAAHMLVADLHAAVDVPVSAPGYPDPEALRQQLEETRAASIEWHRRAARTSEDVAAEEAAAAAASTESPFEEAAAELAPVDGEEE